MSVEEIAGKIAGKAAEKTPSWVERMLIPSLEGIKGELKAINTRIDSTNERITSLESKMDVKFEATDIKITSLDEKIGSLRNEVNIKITSLDEKIGSLRNEVKTEMDSLRNEMKTEITSLDEKIGSLRNETKSEFTGLHYRLDSIDKRIPVIEEIGALKHRIADLEKKLAVA